MTITVDPTATVQEEQSVELGVQNGVTKTVHRIRKNGALRFKNRLNSEPLTIAAAGHAAPFLIPGVAGPQSGFVVPGGTNMTVMVSNALNVGDQFSYSARIGNSNPEDPIIIIDRH